MLGRMVANITKKNLQTQEEKILINLETFVAFCLGVYY